MGVLPNATLFLKGQFQLNVINMLEADLTNRRQVAAQLVVNGFRAGMAYLTRWKILDQLPSL
jgi:hypothetical protein